MIITTCTETMASIATFCCYSHQYLCGEAGAAALIDKLQFGTCDVMPYWGKIAPYFGETCFLFYLIIALLSHRDQRKKLGKSKDPFNYLGKA